MNPHLEKSILGIAQAYGPYKFWLENLFPGANPDATWRALMVISALRDKAFVDQVLALLKSQDSRVRAWACYYLGAIGHDPASDKIFGLTNEPSPRVRHQARQALAILQPGHEAAQAHRRLDHIGFRILISEDSPQGREQLSLLLHQRGFHTDSAATEQDTITLATKNKPEVIITDNQKSRDNLSGLNMTWDICKNPVLRETILIMLTADEVEPMFLWQGGDFFLNKHRLGGARLGQVLEMYMG